MAEDITVRDRDADNRPTASGQQPAQLFGKDIQENLASIRRDFGETMDLVVRELSIEGWRLALCTIEGMTDREVLGNAVLKPILSMPRRERQGEVLYTYLRDSVLTSAEHVELHERQQAYVLLMSGFALLLVDGAAVALCIGLQHFAHRGIQHLDSELTIRGSKEGFCEVLHLNTSMIRRRMKSTQLRFESMRIGGKSQTEVVLCYMADCCQTELLDTIRERLNGIEIDLLMESCYLVPFLENHPVGLFPEVGSTERADVLCSKINEGRVAILVDGTPHALLLPYLFHEHFQSVDDYSGPLLFAFFSRMLKLICFGVTIFFPGIYVAIGAFNPELFPDTILYNVALADATTPFPLMLEALIIFVVFEIIREAGLRLPKAVGGTVSIVGALVLGQAVVSAGLIGAPMIIVVALTAIGSFVLPSLYETMALLRLMFILIGGVLGLHGVSIGITMLVIAICSINNYGVPFTSPLMPFSFTAMRDVFWRANWTKLAKARQNIQDMPGQEHRGESGGGTA